MDTIFMETTVQADKFLGKRSRKHQIKTTCKNNKLISSTYVLGEFKSNFLKDATALYNLVADSDDVRDAMIRFEETFSKRISNRMNKLFANIITTCGIDDKEEILENIEMFIEDILLKRFKEGVDKILIDNTKCERSLAMPQKIDGVWTIDVKCSKRANPKCSIKEFLLDHNLDNIKKLTAMPKELKSVETIVDKIISKSDVPYGNNCRTLGDTIIILEAPDDSKIFTTNIKDFKPICEKIGKLIV
ncbi:hypothetical protein [Clostridium sp.]|uniref:hypothetical protein n=1 Tax=Clostridium sp. TaxID=1506 RepID=UPI001A606D31|nr:hypothetical protein [Clostridium sp.]MBK5236417.1 hypothetical protein [Clostridium sp.]